MQKYEIIERIGEGAYGVVLKCRYNDSGQSKTKTIHEDGEENLVAMKQFKEGDDSEIVKKTTMREVKILKMLQHPNIVELKEAFRKRGIVYLIFQYVPFNLLEVLERTPDGLESEVIRKLIYQLIKGLAYLHSLNIIHRDIKLENLLIGNQNELKICDFGFARQVRKQKREDLTDYVATRWYRPPELLVGADYGREVDLWAVGCILGELVDGNPMFPGENQLDQLFLIQKCLGSLTPQHKEIFIKNPRFLGYKIPDITSLDSIEKRYLGKLPPKGLNLLKMLLKMNPNERITAAQALQHPYFDGVEKVELVRRYSVNNQLRNAAKVIEKEDLINGPNVKGTEKKKYTSNPYDPFLQGQLDRQKTEVSNYTHGQGTALQKNLKLQLSKKPKKEKKFLNSKGLNNGMASRELSRGKGSKLAKEKPISLDKQRDRESIIKTQAGFYIRGGGIIQEKLQEDQEDFTRKNQFQYRNKIYNIRSPKSKKKNRKNNISTEEILQEDPDEVWQSSNQFPFLMIGSQKSTQTKERKASKNPPSNILITNSVFNYKN